LIPVKKKLGYGGSAIIDAYQVLITSGSFDKAIAVSYLNMINTPPSTTMAGRVKHADGTNAYTGTLAFDITEDTLGLFVVTGGLLQRFYEFDVGIFDGENDWKMEKCKLTSLSISGATGGTLNAQVSFLAKEGKVIGATTNDFIRDEPPIGYWYSGTGATDNVKDWTLTMNQEANLVYKNENSMEPAYIRVGLVSYILSVTSFKDLATPTTLLISTKSFTLTGDTSAYGFSYGGLTDLGTYSYTFETGSHNGESDALVIT
jgi:hypothetical protein